MNKAKKGYTKEKRCRDELKEDGWTIAFKSIRWKYGTFDFAGLFDVVAIKDFWLFISVKHLGKSNYYKPHQEEIRAFKEMYGTKIMKFQLWIWDKPIWKGRNPNKIYHKGGWIKVDI